MQDNLKDQPATKGDLKELETRLTGTVTRLATDLAKTHLRIEQTENTLLNTLRNFESNILSSMDKYTSEVQSYRNRDVLRGKEVMGHTTELKNHEDRLVLLETHK
jgi:hypothetical protein